MNEKKEILELGPAEIITQDQMIVELDQYIRENFVSVSRAAREWGKKPQQLNDILHGKTVTTEQIAYIVGKWKRRRYGGYHFYRLKKGA